MVSIQLMSGQALLTKQFNLPDEVNETSGLLFFNDRIITHNDSGGEPMLYEIDADNGELIRKITISNATNRDWEDIAQDDHYIYIADIGNNKGNRENLKIYRIKKEEYLKNDAVKAEIIHISYADQTSYKSSSIHNFDAEALLSVEDELIIFSKNRGDEKSKVYVIPKKIGTHSLAPKHTFDVEGLITGSTQNPNTGKIVLCGYSDGLSPFLILINSLEADTLVRIDLTSNIGIGNQIEGITFLKDNSYYISREKVNRKVGGFSIKIPQSVFVFDEAQLSINNAEIDKYFDGLITNNLDKDYNFKSLKIRDKKDKVVFKQKDSLGNINLEELKSGKYTVRLKVDDEVSIIKKVNLN